MHQTYLGHSPRYVCRIQKVERETERESERDDSTNSSRDGLTFAVPSFASKWYLSNLLRREDLRETDEDGDGEGEEGRWPVDLIPL